MAQRSVSWVESLSASEGADVEPVCSAELVAQARAQLGDGPLGWAVELASDLAREHIRQFPGWAVEDPAFRMSRLGPESGVIIMLLTLSRGEPPSDLLEEDAMVMIREFARRRIPVHEFLQASAYGMARASRALIDACHRYAAPEDRADDAQVVMTWIEQIVPNLVSAMTEEYAVELERWTSSDAAMRADLVQRLLSGGEINVETASNKLNYEISFRWHRATILWDSSAETFGTASLERQINRADSVLGTRRLVVAHGLSELWCWQGKVGSSEPEPPVVDDVPANVNVSVGTWHSGPEGFSRSHEEALAAKRVSQLATRPIGGVVKFEDVELESLLLANTAAARRFVKRHLGALAADGKATEALRETLAAYLDTHSPSQVSAQMHIARNTVSYRLRRAEELLGSPIEGRGAEIAAALRLARLL